MSSDPTLRPDRLPEDEAADTRALRPLALTDFIGQAEARANLRIFSGVMEATTAPSMARRATKISRTFGGARRVDEKQFLRLW